MRKITTTSCPERASSDPRSRRADRPQQSRRQLEDERRERVVAAAERCHASGHSWRRVAQTAGHSERTLRYWRRAPARPRPAPRRRGRRCLSVTVAQRNEVIRFLHHVSGPAIGLPALRALFTDIPRCVLEDVLRRYRRVWRRRYRRRGCRLTWHQPGRTWAMDHSQATQLVDGSYRQIFAVRDLASHCQLTWQPVTSTGSPEIRPVLHALFLQYGPPLVLKSDNGSAFQAEVTRVFLQDWSVAQLFSPPAFPQYNGQLERSNATNKVYTHQQAVTEGHAQYWTSANLEAARQLANTISRPWGWRGPTPDEAWQARHSIDAQERLLFAQEVERQRDETRRVLGIDATQEPTPQQAEELQRRAIAQALEVLGYLTKSEVKRAPRKPKRLPRQSLERALRQQREQRQPNTREDAPADAGEQLLLDEQPAGATMRTVTDAHLESLGTRPLPGTTHREWVVFIWWRRSITLLLSLVKAAKIMH